MGTESESEDAAEREGSWLISGLFFLGAFALLIAGYNRFQLAPLMTVRTVYPGPDPRFAFHLREAVLWGVIGFAIFGVATWMAAQEGLLE